MPVVWTTNVERFDTFFILVVQNTILVHTLYTYLRWPFSGILNMLIHAHCTASFSHALLLFRFSFVSFLFLVAFLTGYLPFTRRKLHTRFNCRGHAQSAHYCTVGLICTGEFHYSISKRWNYRKTSVGCWEIGNKTIRGISPYNHILQPAQQQLAVQIFWNLQWTKEKTGRCLSLIFVIPFKCNKIQPDNWNWHLVGAKHWFTRFELLENGQKNSNILIKPTWTLKIPAEITLLTWSSCVIRLVRPLYCLPFQVERMQFKYTFHTYF